MHLVMSAMLKTAILGFVGPGAVEQVLLNQEAVPIDTMCMNIFDSETSQQLGLLSTCSTQGRILTIWLAGFVDIRPEKVRLQHSTDNMFVTVMMLFTSPSSPYFTCYVVVISIVMQSYPNHRALLPYSLDDCK